LGIYVIKSKGSLLFEFVSLNKSNFRERYSVKILLLKPPDPDAWKKEAGKKRSWKNSVLSV